jgi:predicted ATPase
VHISRGQRVEGFGGKEAYFPVLEAISQLVRSASGGPIVQAMAKLAPTWLIQLPSLLKPEQKQALQQEILGASRERMLREVCELLEFLSAQTPLVLILEDLHWVDPSTLDLISALARRREPAKLLLLCTYRPVDLVLSKSPLKELKQDLQVHHLCREVALELLEESAVTKYLANEFPSGTLPSGLAHVIYRHSGGNALFMAAIVQDMAKRGLIVPDGDSRKLTTPLDAIAPNVPETLQEMLQVQFEQLGEAEQRVLKTASVAGERFSVWAISGGMELESGQIEETCDRLAARCQMIAPAGVQEFADGLLSAYYEFRHSLYRQAIYRQISDAARSRLHVSIANRLKAFCEHGQRELASEVAFHFEAGRAFESTVRFLMIAAQSASERFAYREVSPHTATCSQSDSQALFYGRP